MFSKSQLTAVALSLLSLSEVSFARERWLERDGRSVQLYPRRFGREHPPVIDKLSAACPGAVCGTLAGAAITPLLAAQGECTQQDMADSIIDAAQQFDAATKANMIALAQEYRQAEKNTPPDFTTNPPTNRNSVFCQKAPKNAELNGLVQAQDPANDPNIFFDPATKASVKKGAQANTSPFGTSGAASNSSSAASAASSSAASSSAASSSAAVSSSDVSATSVAATLVAASSSAEPCVQTITVTAAATDAAATTSSAVLAVSTASSAAIGNFGSCSVPQIEFATGFDNRKETSFQPVDKTSYNHGSAQGIDIITKFICDTLTNSCGADATAKATCATASAAADAQAPKTGAQADAFNAAFGITTSFTTVPAVDDQGKVIAGSTGTAAVAAATTAAVDSTTAAAVSSSVAASTTVASAAASTSAATTTSSSAAIGNFGSCSVPQIEFATGFDNRKETSFQPVDKTSFSHGSAQNIDIITQFICDTLTNSCKADATCQSARTAADTKTAKTGAQADAFNAVFGITTNFAAVSAVDDQGNVIAGSSTGTATGNAAAAAPSSTGIGNFGSCTVPQIEFATGFDNRKETSFQPVDKTSYSHGSAQNIDIITQFICDTLTNSCKADATAKATCQSARTAADTKTAKTGAQADAFNAVFGITTNFAAVSAVDDQGNVIAGSSTGSTAATSSAAATTAAATTSTAAASSSAASSAASSSAGIGNFGSCTVPQIEFATGFDNRKETSFQPVDQTSFNHGSAQNIDIITQFICDTLTNSCGADATAKATCQSARAAADTKTAKTGAQADAFNAAFGIKTDFSAVAAVDNQGNVIAGSTA
ncbi:hypothetical protein PHLGIDRAFT_36220 [Phlebiopsis gigantea 11061_1 CR5-6]|uniref:Uncharacterized protein n=1 Tax=Phlebiopsis gigantea (strain 11061_1 CR5-6) TaxID=745531 RepID=A0A0C3NLE4_PHLG1|nr:hypothetical protein PHLGIDRAFT_36220 [Phlebiopsis gigantea 11061_1 CR5-6]